jgi:hypothetical protein
MKVHSYLDDPPRTSLHRGAERLAIEQALDDARLERREHLRQALLRHLPHPRSRD